MGWTLISLKSCPLIIKYNDRSCGDMPLIPKGLGCIRWLEISSGGLAKKRLHRTSRHGRSWGSADKRSADKEISIVGGEHEQEETI